MGWHNRTNILGIVPNGDRDGSRNAGWRCSPLWACSCQTNPCGAEANAGCVDRAKTFHANLGQTSNGMASRNANWRRSAKTRQATHSVVSMTGLPLRRWAQCAGATRAQIAECSSPFGRDGALGRHVGLRRQPFWVNYRRRSLLSAEWG